MRARAFVSLSLAAVVALLMTTTGFAGGKPSVKFTQPKAGATTGSTVTLRVATRNFTIDAKHVGRAPRANRGHIHFSMDGGKYDFERYSGANGKLAAKIGVDGKYSPSVAKSITYRHLPKGRHTVKVFLVKNDHSNYRGATSTLRFTVR